MTYRQVAAAAGRPLAWRAVGNVLNGNHDPAVPCHRVIRSDGRVGGYNRGSRRKLRMLSAEGAKIGRSSYEKKIRHQRPG
jgi:O-6-methylguanine DNA methyltransferase